MGNYPTSDVMTAGKLQYLDRLVRGEITVPSGNSQLQTMGRAGWISQCGAGIDGKGLPTTRWRITEAGRAAWKKALAGRM